ncbi:hypothetical protein E2562_014341 [Oryza meyeriana var. granulata]|uniref:DUF6598 domain-containing protein n=1 Tax=Oryza meyeriana var. granulata TaxID=110450 RepID=A0A6G1C6S2_9ORYZ|nr:hypothetical protein E2562_014341 [Oryza meyeriana var. granulata]
MSKARPGKRCSVEVTFGHLAKAVEAAIEVRIVQGSSDFHGRFLARTDGFDGEVVLLDSSDGSVPVAADGVIKLARSVVVVESTGVLNLYVITQRGHGQNIVTQVTKKGSRCSGDYAVDVAAEDHCCPYRTLDDLNVEHVATN